MTEVTMGDRVHTASWQWSRSHNWNFFRPAQVMQADAKYVVAKSAFTDSPSVPLDTMDPSVARFWSDIGLTPPTDIPPLPADSDAINDANRDDMAMILATALSQIQSQVPPQVTPFQDLATAAVRKTCHKPFVDCLAKCGAQQWLLLFEELWISSWSVFGTQAVKNPSTEEWNSKTLALYELYLLEDEDLIITFIDKTTARTQIGDRVFMGEFQKNLMRHAFQHFRNRCFYAADQLLKGGPSHQGLIPPTITSHEGIVQFANICTMWDPVYGYMLFHELVPIAGSDKFQLVCFRNRSFLDICHVAINAVDTSAFFGIFEKTTGADNRRQWGTLRYCPTHSLALITTWSILRLRYNYLDPAFCSKKNAGALPNQYTTKFSGVFKQVHNYLVKIMNGSHPNHLGEAGQLLSRSLLHFARSVCAESLEAWDELPQSHGGTV
ncbi:hypothetical protein BDN67DRAFT_986033 [Paxillus ammoniavirescens]|nr:hypothetical protein BDN67DRAFT_986033 [Paxillus ammoniavirescens]